MLGCAIACALFAAAGFGLGRVKNAAKLKAAHDLLTKEELKASAAAKALIARVRAAL